MVAASSWCTTSCPTRAPGRPAPGHEQRPHRSQGPLGAPRCRLASWPCTVPRARRQRSPEPTAPPGCAWRPGRAPPPCGRRPRHRHGQRAFQRQRPQALRPVEVQVPAVRTEPAAAHRPDLARRLAHHGEQVAADPALAGKNEPRHRCHGQRGIDRVASADEDLTPYAADLGMARRHHGVGSERGGAVRRGASVRGLHGASVCSRHRPPTMSEVPGGVRHSCAWCT